MKSKKKLSRTLHTLYQPRRTLWNPSEKSNFLKIHRRIFWVMIFQNTLDGMKYPSWLRSLVIKWDWTVLKDVSRYLFTVGFRNTYLPSTPNIEMKSFEKSEVFENSPAYFQKVAFVWGISKSSTELIKSM